MKQYKVHFENFSHEPILGQREDRLEKKPFHRSLMGGTKSAKSWQIKPKQNICEIAHSVKSEGVSVYRDVRLMDYI